VSTDQAARAESAPASTADVAASDVFPDHTEELMAFVGTSAGPARLAPVPVNEAMIQHWVEAMGDTDPVYGSEEAARAAGLPGVIAPPTMLQAWVMRGLRLSLQLEAARAEGRTGEESATEQMTALLDDEGLTSVVATNCDQRYERPLVLGERLVCRSTIDAISAVKRTGLGEGRFVTTLTEFAVVHEPVGQDSDAEALFEAGEPVASMTFRILKFRPPAQPGDGNAPAAPPLSVGGDAHAPARRPRPAITQDIEFFFDGARQGKLLIQRCTSCGTLRHPPLPACAECRSFEWDTVESSGRGTVFSFVVVHHPQVPGFDYPLPIALVELEEGTRFLADLVGVDPDRVTVGMPVAAEFITYDDALTLPAFGPRPTDGGTPAA